IEIAAALLDPVHAQNHVPLEVGIPVGYVGIAAVPVPGPVGANERRYREAASRAKDSVTLPAANQLLHPAGGSTAERLAVPEWQLIAEVAVELVQETKGGGSFVEPSLKTIQNRRRLIIGRSGEDGGIGV